MVTKISFSNKSNNIAITTSNVCIRVLLRPSVYHYWWLDCPKVMNKSKYTEILVNMLSLGFGIVNRSLNMIFSATNSICLSQY